LTGGLTKGVADVLIEVTVGLMEIVADVLTDDFVVVLIEDTAVLGLGIFDMETVDKWLLVFVGIGDTDFEVVFGPIFDEVFALAADEVLSIDLVVDFTVIFMLDFGVDFAVTLTLDFAVVFAGVGTGVDRGKTVLHIDESSLSKTSWHISFTLQ
jgi:hypothetical protein